MECAPQIRAPPQQFGGATTHPHMITGKLRQSQTTEGEQVRDPKQRCHRGHITAGGCTLGVSDGCCRDDIFIVAWCRGCI